MHNGPTVHFPLVKDHLRKETAKICVIFPFGHEEEEGSMEAEGMQGESNVYLFFFF